MTAPKVIEAIHNLTKKRWQNDLGRAIAAYLDEKGLEYRLNTVDGFTSRITIFNISFMFYNEVVYKGLSQISNPFDAAVTLVHPYNVWTGQGTIKVNADIDWNNMKLDKFYARLEETRDTKVQTLVEEGFRFSLEPTEEV